jgi:hypothetical protein
MLHIFLRLQKGFGTRGLILLSFINFFFFADISVALSLSIFPFNAVNNFVFFFYVSYNFQRNNLSLSIIQMGYLCCS